MNKGLLENKFQLQYEEIEIEGYEKIVKVTDKVTDLTAIIAIHSTSLGPALGGIRIYPYASFDDALFDVLRLAKGMTYKAAVAGLSLGGGKSVIIADPRKDKSKELLTSFALAIESFQGKYICAEDSGCSTADVKIISDTTKYVVGLVHEKSSGDPSGFTAFGTYRGIQSVLQKLDGSTDLRGKKVAIQGLGNVGYLLMESLFWAGAKVVASDLNQQRLLQVQKDFGVEIVSTDEILFQECDVLAPCAMGGIISADVIPKLRCRAIAGCANNQLLKDEDGQLLVNRKILYAPDFVINSGGLLNVAQEITPKGYCPKASREKIDHIFDTLLTIYEIAGKNKISTHNAAKSLAEYRIQYRIGKTENKPVFHHSI